MKHIALIAAIFASQALANDQMVELNKPIQCSKPELMFQTLRSEYQEVPLWGGTKERSQYVLMVNHSTTTWSLVEFDKNVACLIDAGEGFRLTTASKKTS